MYIYTSTSHVRMCICICICMQFYIFRSTYTYVHTPTDDSTGPIVACACICTCIYIYVYNYISSHVRIHLYALPQVIPLDAWLEQCESLWVVNLKFIGAQHLVSSSASRSVTSSASRSVTWLIHVCDVTHSCLRRELVRGWDRHATIFVAVYCDVLVTVTWCIRVRNMMLSCVRRDSLLAGTWLRCGCMGEIYGVATIRRLLTIIGLFCKRAL